MIEAVIDSSYDSYEFEKELFAQDIMRGIQTIQQLNFRKGLQTIF